jgi:hypothetical protein
VSALKSIADLASDACAMPWEDRAPFNARYAFQQAVTPELFIEILGALKLAREIAVEYAEESGAGPLSGIAACLKKIDAAIANATGATND